LNEWRKIRDTNNIAKSPYFTAPVDSANSVVNATAVVMLKTQPWYVVFVQPQSELLAPVDAQIRNALWLVLIVTGLIIVMAVLLARQLTQSLTELANTVTQFASGGLTVRTSIHSKDEIGLLADNFNAMSEQVEQLLKRLEKRTLELEISQQVTMSVVELSRSLQDQQRLLQETIAIMQSLFGLNEVRIYLLDQDTHQLIQRASSGESGIFFHQPDRFLCNDAHSIVARAAQTQTTILVNGVNSTTNINPTTNINQTAIQTALWKPEIGSEVAVPLVNRGNLLGVLDIQDKKPHRFSELGLEAFNINSRFRT
jgi:nitrate/nitrite-specific signal transduction histidine kinase